MKVKKVLPIVLAALSVILVATLILTTMFSGQDDSVICEGVSINGIDVGGMTPEEATEAISDHIVTMQNKSISIKIDDQMVSTTLGELGYSCNVEESVEQAMSLGKTGNFLNRYREKNEIEQNGVELNLVASLDEAVLRTFVETNCTQYDVEPENANLTRENGQFVIMEHTSGRKVSVEDTMELIKTYVATEDYTSTDKIQIEAVVANAEPEYTTEMVSLCTDVLGKFSTSYATSSSSRAGNVANGARLINGSIVWPGETFSTGGTMNPITAENGYFMAGAYENGQVVDSIGGGVCQVATTLYNAVLLSELEVVERSNHSMIVGYVKPSMDAAIAGTYKDFKFKNNTDAPIYIEGVTAGRVITFTIYGHETRPENRTIQYVSEVLQVINPGADKVTEDPTKPTDYREVTQSAHVGYKAQLWKVVYENGTEVSREKVNYSSYAPEPAYVTVGTKEVEKEDDKVTDNNKDNDKNNNKDKDKDKDKDKETGTATKPEQENGSTSGEGTEGAETTTPEQGGAAGTEESTTTPPEEGAVG